VFPTTTTDQSPGLEGPPASSALRTRAREEQRDRLNLSWLVHLHWYAIAGQVALIWAAVAVTRIGVPMATLAGFIAAELTANGLLWVWSRNARVTDAGIAAVMLIDAAALTVLLDLTGGASNPFSILYLVNVALSAVLLSRRWAWMLTGASLAGFGALFVHERFYGASHHISWHLDPAQMMEAHLRTMWVAFALASVFVVFFVQRVTGELATRERELRDERVRAERREKLASLATLAAGAAHELSTPLSTIAVVAKELQRALPADASQEARDDLQLVRDQVARCRDILDRMAARAGENVGEPLAPIAVPRLIASALDGLRARERVELEIDPAAEEAQVAGPFRGLGDALRGLLKNAIQASDAGAPVKLRASRVGSVIRFAVADRGRGMPPEVLARVGEPFFTTKVPGEGMGLGLFLTRALAEHLGGEFHITSIPGTGTEARIDLPAVGAGERSIV
jgi:two-component system sensor histidine kinase RegB